MILFITICNPKFNNINSFSINGDYEKLWEHIKKHVKKKQLNNSSYSVYYDIEYVINSYNIIKSDSFDFYIKIDYDDSIIIYKVYNSCNFDQELTCFEERYIYSKNNEGNCIDDFIRRGVNPLIDNIKDMISEINKRLPQRQVAVEYHRTSCFEKDFSQISLIKKYAQTIVDNCNKQLERISENYTKINY